MRYAERKALRQEQERLSRREQARHRRRWKRLSGRTAHCYSCKKESTYGELHIISYPAHPHSKKNRCEPCFDKEINEDSYSPGFGERYPGEEIWWKTSP